MRKLYDAGANVVVEHGFVSSNEEKRQWFTLFKDIRVLFVLRFSP